ncbi:MAG: ATP-binding cassette domain-containing protein [Chloroflexi bacterium]|nr:ATP-binding cassette domain-containing protein [Chloroflexota bacterium]MBV9542778.1 ATP-binding cassette domain-containing protein [Chloroflexota bacterium]
MALLTAEPQGTDGARDGRAPVVEVEDLVKEYGRGKRAFRAVKGVSFDVYPGEVFGFLGPNGAGKTTTISVLCTLLQPTSGQVRIAGFDVQHQATEVRRSIGLIFQDPTLDGQLSAQENLDFHAFAYDVPQAEARTRGERLMKLVDLWDRRNDQVKMFSGGMKRRLEIVRGLLHRPSVLFLDEPTQGLDPQTRSLIWNHLLGLRRDDGVTLFMTTHYMDEAEYCDRIAIIDHGEIVALDTPANLKAMVGGDVVVIRTTDNQLARAEIEERWGRAAVEHGRELRLEVEHGDEFVPELVRGITPRVEAISVSRPTLDDVFMKLTGHAIREQEAGAVDFMRQAGRMWGGGRR